MWMKVTVLIVVLCTFEPSASSCGIYCIRKKVSDLENRVNAAIFTRNAQLVDELDKAVSRTSETHLLCVLNASEKAVQGSEAALQEPVSKVERELQVIRRWLRNERRRTFVKLNSDAIDARVEQVGATFDSDFNAALVAARGFKRTFYVEAKACENSIDSR